MCVEKKVERNNEGKKKTVKGSVPYIGFFTLNEVLRSDRRENSETSSGTPSGASFETSHTKSLSKGALSQDMERMRA